MEGWTRCRVSEEVRRERKPNRKERNSSTAVHRMDMFSQVLSFLGKPALGKDALKQLDLVLPAGWSQNQDVAAVER